MTRIEYLIDSLDRNKYKTNKLFPVPSFIVGMGSVFNVFGNYFQFTYSKKPGNADFDALENDWDILGKDFSKALKKFENEFVPQK